MSNETKALFVTGIVTAIILVGAVFFLSKNDAGNPTSDKPADAKVLVRKNSNKIEATGAKVTVVEFGDFQCPSCGAAHPMVKQILEAYKGKINFVFRHFPFPQHKNAMIAAEAAEAAGAQGKFWEMHDLLFEHQADWSESDKPMEIFQGYAKKLSLDIEKLTKEVKDEAFKNKILADQADGDTLGVNATPTFFINGEKIVGASSYDVFKAKIDGYLSK